MNGKGRRDKRHMEKRTETEGDENKGCGRRAVRKVRRKQIRRKDGGGSEERVCAEEGGRNSTKKEAGRMWERKRQKR